MEHLSDGIGFFKVNNCHLGEKEKRSLPFVQPLLLQKKGYLCRGATRAKLQMEQHILGSCI